MILAAIDSFKLVDRFENAGFTRAQAKVLAESELELFIELTQSHLATKDDLKDFATKNDLKDFAKKDDLKDFVRKDDLKNFATKDDIKNFATKDDLKIFATKDDLKNYSTKDDIKNLEIKIYETRVEIKESQNYILKWMMILMGASVTVLSLLMSVFKFLH